MPATASCRYPQLLLGYAGITHPVSTLNARFYSLFANDILGEMGQDLPQRIPRPGFLDEVFRAEGDTAAVANVRARQRTILDWVERAFRAPMTDLSQQQLAYMLRLATRYGCDPTVLDKMAQSLSPASVTPSLAFELLFTRHWCNPGSAGNSSGETLNLARQLLGEAGHSGAVRLTALTRAIVACFRYGNADEKNSADALCETFLADSTDWERTEAGGDENTDLRRVAMTWRALAFHRRKGPEFQKQCLQRSLEISRGIEPRNVKEEILKDENIYTTLQSIARWHEMTRNNDWKHQVVETRTQIIGLDPWDSTGHSELALFHMRQRDWLSAIPCLRRAVELGPPGLALNQHFLGYALKQTGNISEARYFFESSAELDDKALSPRLELVDVYERLGLESRVAEVRNSILRSPPLLKQLTAAEMSKLRSASGISA